MGVASFADIRLARHAIFMRDEPKECLRRRLREGEEGEEDYRNTTSTRRSSSRGLGTPEVKIALVPVFAFTANGVKQITKTRMRKAAR